MSSDGDRLKLSGQIYYYRVFDVGWEIDLLQAQTILGEKSKSLSFKIKRIIRNIVIEQPPLIVSLGQWQEEIGGIPTPIVAVAKIWSFGAISILFILDFQVLALQELKQVSSHLEDDEQLHNKAEEEMQVIFQSIQRAVSHPGVWKQFEDYLLFNLKTDKQNPQTGQAFIEENDLYQLIFADPNQVVGQQLKDQLKLQTLQYTDQDLTVIDWNSALVVDQADTQEISDVIEFALCQLLELRYYDDLLDSKLNSLYRSIKTSPPSIFNTKYRKSVSVSSLLYIEISEIVEKVENSLKVIGDFYYAQIYRLAIAKFRLKDWQNSIDQKLTGLADVSKLFHGEINERRSHFLELIIIILIVIEVIPLVFRVISRIFS